MTPARTSAQRLLALCAELGADYVFSNLGSDHPAFIEAFAVMKQAGERMPQVIVCPHEMTALSAAHGYSMLTRRPQLVLVHVDVGTQNLGGSVHNAARGRVPALIIAGLSPVTENAGLRGGRNEFIHDLQDAPDQQGIVDQYMKWSYEIRTPETIDGVILRAMQFARMQPQGPVYLTGAREVWEGPAPNSKEPAERWPIPEMGGLGLKAAEELAIALRSARRPLAITSYLGRNPEAVEVLVELSDRVGLGITEVSPGYMNFPGDHPHHLGYRRNTLVEEADFILLLDVDVPWLKSKVSPAAGTRIAHIDVDPIKSGIGFWHYPTEWSFQADTGAALREILMTIGDDPAGTNARKQWIAQARDSLTPVPDSPVSGPISAVELSRAIRALVTERSVVVFEAPTATEVIPSVLRLSQPGSYLNSGGTGLGWGTNAALGVKLARPESEVIALVGDGSFQFGVPSSTYWVASTYDIPFLTVIFNNGGWNAPKFSTLGVHPQGEAMKNDTFWATMTSGMEFADVARASGNVAGFTITDRNDLQDTLEEAMGIVRSGRAVVVDARIEVFSRQVLGRTDGLRSV